METTNTAAAVNHSASDSLKAVHLTGYAANEFPGKREQMLQVVAEISNKGFIPADLVETEVAWFYQYDNRVLIEF